MAVKRGPAAAPAAFLSVSAPHIPRESSSATAIAFWKKEMRFARDPSGTEVSTYSLQKPRAPLAASRSSRPAAIMCSRVSSAS